MAGIRWWWSLLWVCCGLAHAAPTYPDRVITLVSPFSATSDTTRFGQYFAQYASKYLDSAKLIVESRPGASGSAAARSVQVAAPDGYTLFIGRVATQVIAPAIDPRLGYHWNDFTFLGILEVNPLICAVRSDSPYEHIRDLIAAMRKSPGTLKYSTSGPATILNLVPQYMLKLSGLHADAALAMHLDGGKAATDAMLAGQVDFVCNNADSLIDLIQQGKVRALFTTAPGRLEALPQLQNAREAGMRDLCKLLGWTVLLGPPNLPQPVVARWKNVLQQVGHDPAWRTGTIDRGGIPALGSSNDTMQFVREQADFFEKLVYSLNLRQ